MAALDGPHVGGGYRFHPVYYQQFLVFGYEQTERCFYNGLSAYAFIHEITVLKAYQ
jgi:hypothetical protein